MNFVYPFLRMPLHRHMLCLRISPRPQHQHSKHHYMKKMHIPLLFLLAHQTLMAQFFPGDVGYLPEMRIPYATMHVKTQTQTLVEDDSSLVVNYINTFDTTGLLLETKFPQAADGGEEEWIEEFKNLYTYFPDGRIRVIELDGYDSEPIVMGFEYDKKNRLEASVIASAEAREYTYTLDKSGRVIERRGKGARWVYADEMDTEGTLTMVDLEFTEYQWDDKGRLIGETYWYMNEWANRVSYAYNAQGLLQTTLMYYDNSDAAPAAYSIEYTYDANGLPTSSQMREDGIEVNYIYTYTYY